MPSYENISEWVANANNNSAISAETLQYLMSLGLAERDSANVYSIKSNVTSETELPGYEKYESGVEYPVIASFLDNEGKSWTCNLEEADYPDRGSSTAKYGTWKRVSSSAEEVFSIEETLSFHNRSVYVFQGADTDPKDDIPSVTDADDIDASIQISDPNNTNWVFLPNVKYKDHQDYVLSDQGGGFYKWEKKPFDITDIQEKIYAHFDASDSSNYAESGGNLTSVTELTGNGVNLTALKTVTIDSSGPLDMFDFSSNGSFRMYNGGSALFNSNSTGNYLGCLNLFLVIKRANVNYNSNQTILDQGARNGFKLYITPEGTIVYHMNGVIAHFKSSVNLQKDQNHLVHVRIDREFETNTNRQTGDSQIDFISIIVDGKKILCKKEINVPVKSRAVLNIGGGNNATSYFRGSIGEVIISDDKEIKQHSTEIIQGYLANKWNITLESDNKYYSSPPYTLELRKDDEYDPQDFKSVESFLWKPDLLESKPKFWVDFSDKSKYILNDDKTVQKFVDKYGNEFTTEHKFGITQPDRHEYIESQLNGRRVLDLAENEFLRINNIDIGEKNHKFFIVARIRDVDANSDSLFSIDSSIPDTMEFQFAAVENDADRGKFLGWIQAARGSTGGAAGSPTFGTDWVDDSWHIFECRFDVPHTNGVDRAFFSVIDGTANSSEAIHRNRLGSSVKLLINNNRREKQGVNCQIGEFLMINTNDEESILKVQAYLAHKWGLAHLLPSSHKYKKIAPQKNEKLQKLIYRDTLDAYILLGGNNAKGMASVSDLTSPLNAIQHETVFECRYHDTLNDATTELKRDIVPKAVNPGNTSDDSSLFGLEVNLINELKQSQRETPAILKYYVEDAGLLDWSKTLSYKTNSSNQLNAWDSLTQSIEDFKTAVEFNYKKINFRGVIILLGEEDLISLNSTSYEASLKQLATDLRNENLLDDNIPIICIEPQHNTSGTDHGSLSSIKSAFANFESDSIYNHLVSTSDNTIRTNGMIDNGGVRKHFNSTGFNLIAGATKDLINDWNPSYLKDVDFWYDFNDLTTVTNSVILNLDEIENKIDTGARNTDLVYNSSFVGNNGTVAAKPTIKNPPGSLSSLNISEFSTSSQIKTTDAVFGNNLGDDVDEFSIIISFMSEGAAADHDPSLTNVILESGDMKFSMYSDNATSGPKFTAFEIDGDEIEDNNIDAAEIYSSTQGWGDTQTKPCFYEISFKKNEKMELRKLINLPGDQVRDVICAKDLNAKTHGAHTLQLGGGSTFSACEIIGIKSLINDEQRRTILSYLRRKWLLSSDSPPKFYIN